MNYSPAHILRIVGISQETFRHWRKVLPPLSERKGRDKFTLGDALALLVVKDLCSVLGIQVKTLVPFSNELFTFCNPLKWDTYIGKYITYQPVNSKFEVIDETSGVREHVFPVVLIDINKHIRSVKNYVLGLDIDDQQLELLFSPRLVSNEQQLSRSVKARVAI